MAGRTSLFSQCTGASVCRRPACEALSQASVSIAATHPTQVFIPTFWPRVFRESFYESKHNKCAAIRCVPLYLYDYLAAGQSDTVRPRTVHMEKRFVAIAPSQTTAPREQPLSLWRADCDSRPFCGISGAPLDGGALPQCITTSIAGHGRRGRGGHRRHCWAEHSVLSATGGSSHTNK